MGLSLRNIGKKIEDVIGSVTSSGRPQAQLQNAPQNSAQAPAPHPGPVQVANTTASLHGAYVQPPPNLGFTPSASTQSTGDLFHNPLTNFVGSNIVKPLARIPIDVSNQVYNRAVAPVLKTPHLTPQQVGPIKGVARELGADGSTHQAVGDLIQGGLTLATGGAGGAIEKGAASIIPKAAPKIVAKVAPKVVSNAAFGGSFNAAAAAGQNETPGQIFKSGVEGTAAGAIPIVGVAVKPAARLVAKGASRVGQAIADAADKLPVDTKTGSRLDSNKAVPVTPTEVPVAPKVVTEAVTPTEKASVTTATRTAPQGPVVAPKITIPKTSMPEVDAAIKDVSSQYTQPAKFSGTLKDVVKQAQGVGTVGSRAANGLRKVLGTALSKEENQSVSDILDNHPGAVKAATSKAREVAAALKPLQDQGFAVRQAIDPNVNRVRDYVAHIPANTVGAAADTGVKVLGKIRSLADITNLNSRFSQARKVGKFVDSKGKAIYGNPRTLGLVQHNDGTATNKAGEVLKQVAVSKRELEANGAGKYEHNISRISGIYHADTASLKVRAEALQHIKSSPEALGLSTIQEPGMVPITKVSELADYFGKPEDVRALEDGFGYKNSAGPIGKTYDVASNLATQAIVLNPFFHGMNQLIQSGIAAGNLPGMGTGWAKVLLGMGHMAEQDIRDYLTAGGHIPDYGMGRENLLSGITHGASKINNKAMSAIETKLRVGLYKASIDAGMAPKEAVKNIDKFLGDASHIDVTTRRATLFLHYFKTMAGALGSQIAHPIENKGATANTLAIASLFAAATYGYREFTGNKNAYIRVPGELGLAKEAVGSVEGLAHGDPTKATQIATNRINPVLKEGMQQGFNKDLFSGKKVTDTPGGRLGHVVSNTIAPAQTIGRMTNATDNKGASKSLPETAGNQLGLYEPHARGDVATTNPKVSFINTPKAKVAQGNDPTGYKQQQAYFDTSKQAKKGLSSSDQNLFDQLTASTTKLNDKQIQAHYDNLSGSPKVLDAITKQKQEYAKRTGTPVDPLYSNDITPEQRQAYLHMLSTPYKGDDYIQQQDANGGTQKENGWMYKLTQARNDYFDKTDFNGASKAERVKPPTFDSQTEADLTAVDKLDGKDKALFIQAHPNVQQAYDSLAKYTNDKRVAQGNAPFKLYPGADPGTQAALNEMAAVPKGGGSKGGNKYIADWIKSNPDKYAKIQNYYTSVSEWELANSAGQDKYQGATPNQQELKSAYNLGQYDIAVTKNADGTKSYALNPSAAASAYGTSYSGSSSSYDPTSRRAYKDAKALKYTNKIPKIGAKIKRPSVKVSGAKKPSISRSSKNRVAAKSAGMVVTKSKV